MKKNEIIQKLKELSGSDNIRLPKDLDLSLDQKKLIVSLNPKSVTSNLQDDNSAFEGWILILKNQIKDIEKVRLSWDVPEFENILNHDVRHQHYQRFLYRVNKFKGSFSWFEIDDENKISLKLLKTENSSNLILNTPKNRNPVLSNNECKELSKLSESELEKYIIENEQTSIKFKETFDLELVSYQLPVGLFQEKISKHNRIFPGGKSAIDIYGINNKNRFCLFELKKSGNKKVGAISEMLFYSWVIHDIQRGVFEVESTSENSKKISKSKGINCYLLAPETHPLIDISVLKLMSMNSYEINYLKAKIKDDWSFVIDN